MRRRRQQGQALVELALVVPFLLLLGTSLIGVGRVTQVRMGVNVVARDAARAGALASSPEEAAARGVQRGQDVALSYGLGDGSLQLIVDASGYGRGGRVVAQARYVVRFVDLPLLGWAQVPLTSTHAEPVDPYRGGPSLRGRVQP